MATQQSDTTSEHSTGFVAFFGRFFPGSFALAAVLAILTLLVTTPYLGTMTQLELFSTGFYDLFPLQMSLILYWVLSATVVESEPVGRVFDRIPDAIPTTQRAIIYSTGFIALAFGWLNWALGLIGGVYVGQKLCRRAKEAGVAVHYPLVLTGALLSLVLANQGPTSLGALVMADTTGTANFLLDSAGSIGFLEFLLGPANVVASAVLIPTLPLVLVALAPDDEADRTGVAETESVLESTIAETLDHYSSPPREEYTLADRLEQSRLISMIAVVPGAVSVVGHFATDGGLTLPWLLFSLIAIGLFVHVRPMAFREKTTGATRWANHVAIPFLFYAVVFSLLSEAGLYEPIGSALGAIGSTAVGSFVAAHGVGLLIPDPGSLWVGVGPAVLTTEVDLVTAIVAVMYGAGLSNLWLGFVFAGTLPDGGIDWREFVRYAAVITAYVSLVVLVALLAL